LPIRLGRHARAAVSGTGVGLLLAGLVTLVQAELSPALLHSSAPVPVKAQVGTVDPPVQLVPVRLPVESLPVEPASPAEDAGRSAPEVAANGPEDLPVTAASEVGPADPGSETAGPGSAGSAAAVASDVQSTGDPATAQAVADAPPALSPAADPAPEASPHQPAGRAAVSSPDPPPADAESSEPTATVGRSVPVRIDIDAIGVHAPVTPTGLADDGTLGVPPPGPHYDDTAWYDRYPTPGEVGPAVITGHLDSAHDGPSVFYRLGALRPGDHVVITRADGSIVTFTVTGLGRYPQRAFPIEKVYGDLNHAGLRLITCGGDLDPRTHHYLDNVVVYATLTSATSDGPVRTPSD
jgi:sortase (surface protein transpeptidase)